MKCVICQRQFTNNSDISAALCGHIFHRACITHRLKISQVCPVCGETCSINSIHKVFVTFDKVFTAKHFQEQIESLNNNLTSKINHIKMFEERNKKQQDTCMNLVNGIYQNERHSKRISDRIYRIKNGINVLNGMVPSLRRSMTINERRKLSLTNLLSDKNNSVAVHKMYITSIKARIIKKKKTYRNLKELQAQEKRYLKNKLDEYKKRLKMAKKTTHVYKSLTRVHDLSSKYATKQGHKRNNSSLQHEIRKKINKK
ncbi:E3 ubiquitin-protein ligase trul-1 [Aethina tumida]|uniref:E3 ubiquitin-protein ligase trul-1 n=1 Tax=Aethina tumida TaxID=116153 RepID=UPI0021495106|nr:E3 ubiquitin-protein ligase trul-1 [Aethina tumida]